MAKAQHTGRIPIFSVREVTAQIRDHLRRTWHDIWVAGEIADISRPASGHVYFTLKDQQAQLRAVLWRTTAQSIRVNLQEGQSILCRGELDVYARQGSYQLMVRAIELRGEGPRQRALRELRDRLAAEGLFDVEGKKSLPRFPRFIAVITSPTGAAIQDFLQVAQRRWNGTRILVIPAAVQGEFAVPENIRAIVAAHRLADVPEVLVITRGGGSLEDLWAYNDERLVRIIAKSRIPIVSAVGHEIDVSLCDLAADLRALTPSEAAERILPDQTMWREHVVRTQQSLRQLITSRIRWYKQRVSFFARHPTIERPMDRISDYSRQVDELAVLSERCLRSRLDAAWHRYQSVTSKLEALSPLAVLSRGYAVVTRTASPSPLRNVDNLLAGDSINVQLHQGVIDATVQSTRRRFDHHSDGADASLDDDGSLNEEGGPAT